MGGHQIWYQILVLAQSPVHLLVFLHKLPVDAVLRFPHHFQHRIRHMLRGHLQLAADVVLAPVSYTHLDVYKRQL